MSPFFEKLKVSFLTILFFFLCLLLFTKLFGPLNLATINSNDSNVFTVDGTANVSATPKTATVSVSITKIATTASDAQQQVNAIASKFTNDIKALGVQDKDIKTTNYSSNPVFPSVTPVTIYNTEQAPATITLGQASGAIAMPIRGPQPDGSEYSVSEDLQINTPSVAIANKVLDAATKDGADTIGGVQFTLSDDEQTQLQNKARTEAIQNAKQKAQEIAKESGIHLGNLINVQENDNGGAFPLYAAAKATTGSSQNPTNLQPGQNQVSITVTLSYETN